MDSVSLSLSSLSLSLHSGLSSQFKKNYPMIEREENSEEKMRADGGDRMYERDGGKEREKKLMPPG